MVIRSFSERLVSVRLHNESKGSTFVRITGCTSRQAGSGRPLGILINEIRTTQLKCITGTVVRFNEL